MQSLILAIFFKAISKSAYFLFCFCIPGLYIPDFFWLRARRMEGDHSGAAEKV